ncbi:hypothetical protein [Blastococcus sp. SYSU DS1024]
MLTTRLDRTTVRAAVALANRAPSVHNSQPWRWRIGTSSIHLFADPDRALPITDPQQRGLIISCGAALHHLRVALLATGSASQVHRLPDPARPDHLAAVELSPAQPTADDLALAQAIENRRSDRRVFSTWPVPADTSRTWGAPRPTRAPASWSSIPSASGRWRGSWSAPPSSRHSRRA